jgi:hypothetical protein
MEAIDTFINSMLTIDRWPFWTASVVFALVGHFTQQSVFTRPRAYTKRGWQPFWWWGRESLPLHPVAVGILLGKLWHDPEGRGWSSAASCAYFALAGAVSLVLWVAIKGVAKKKGLELTLPGDSSIPPPPRVPSDLS